MSPIRTSAAVLAAALLSTGTASAQRGATPPAATAPAPIDKAALSKRYSTVIARASRNKTLLAARERKDSTQGIKLPADVRAARDSIDAQMQEAINALNKKDDALLEKKLQALESSVVVIEKYLKP